MRKSRLTQEQMVAILREADRDLIASVAKNDGISLQTIYLWRKRFGTFEANDVRSLKQLESENEWTREGLAIEVDGRIRSGRVIEALSRLVDMRGEPQYLRSDNWPEFVSRALLKWIVDQGIETALIDPGKPWQTRATESFNGKFRDECLSLEWFRSRAEAKVVTETWRRHFNTVRPYSSLGCLTPSENVAKEEKQSAASVRATGRDADIHRVSATRPVAQPSRKGQAKAETRVAVSS